MHVSVRGLFLVTLVFIAGCQPAATPVAPARPTAAPATTAPASAAAPTAPELSPAGIAAAAEKPATTTDPEKTTVLFSITSDFAENPQSIDMAMKLADFSLDENRRVFVFFNVKGVRIPANTFAEDSAFGDELPIKTQLRNLMKRGAEVHVCPVCMRSLKVAAPEIMEGVTITNRAKLFANIGPHTVVFTY